MTDTIAIGTIMVQNSTPMPTSLMGAQSYSGGWSVVIDPNRSQLARELESSGWTVSNTADEMTTTGFGLDQQTLIRKAVVQAIKVCQIMSF